MDIEVTISNPAATYNLILFDISAVILNENDIPKTVTI
jgi:hypothetical protein